MTEDEALEEIAKRCRSTDFEGNGCELDHIICSFLLANGFTRLAEAFANVDCWRA